MKVDFLIVGQGIAGSVLAWKLVERGKKVLVVDPGNENSASKVAAGIMNPVTGKRFVKSWRIDHFFPFALDFYSHLSSKAHLILAKELKILLALVTPEQVNDFSSRVSLTAYRNYIRETELPTEILSAIHQQEGWGLISAARVDIGKVTDTIHQYLTEHDAIRSEKLNYNELEITTNAIRYRDIETEMVIFSEGYQSFRNPYFSYLPHVPVKGELLEVKIEDFQIDFILKAGVFIVPIGEDKFWIGSNYIKDFENEEPTEEGRTDLIKKLQEILKIDFEVVDHKAAIRPVFKDRRPVIGLHHKHARIGIFNGLGTKGASLAPYWADHFCKFLIGEIPELDREVNVERFYKRI